MLRATLLLALAALGAGCQAPTLYSWGHYEDIIYTSYTKPDKALPEQQVELMTQDLEKARAHNKPVPPGFHAHLGYAYYQLGKLDNARQEFEAEKAQFPESAVFMDRLIANLAKK
jgi:hypothetical protein